MMQLSLKEINVIHHLQGICQLHQPHTPNNYCVYHVTAFLTTPTAVL